MLFFRTENCITQITEIGKQLKDSWVESEKMFTIYIWNKIDDAISIYCKDNEFMNKAFLYLSEELVDVNSCLICDSDLGIIVAINNHFKFYSYTQDIFSLTPFE